MLTRDQKNQNSLNLFLNNYFNLILVFVLALVLLGAYLAFIKPKYQETKLLIQNNLEQQQRLYTEQVKKLNSLKVISDLYEKIPIADLDKFNEVLPDDYVKEALFGELEEIITQNGFVVNSISLSDSGLSIENEEEANSKEKVGSLSINLSLSAINYNNLKNLLRLLESNLRLFDVTEINFDPGGNGVELILSTYYYKN
mgnify:CR=1 FL=1